MERPPEEHCYAEHGEEGVKTLLDFAGHGEFLLLGVLLNLGSLFLGGGGELLLCDEENEQGDEHGSDGGHKRVVDAGVEHGQVFVAEVVDGRDGRLGCDSHSGGHLGDEGVEVVGVLHVHAVGDGEHLMAERGEVGVVGHVVDAEPPAAEHRGDKRRDEAADIDKHVENLET